MAMLQSRPHSIVVLFLLTAMLITGCGKARTDGKQNPQKPYQDDVSKEDKSDAADKNAKAATKNPAIAKAVAYLFRQQAADGIWHSPNYGNLKGGAGISALVLYAISHTPPQYWQSKKTDLQKCVAELEKNIAKHGFVANSDGPDYSNYGSAMFLVAVDGLAIDIKEKTRTTLIEYLVRAQLDEGEGFDKTADDYGGWDLSGWMTGKRPTTGSNISVSASVLEALRHQRERIRDNTYDQSKSGQLELATKIDACLAKANPWVIRCRADDGGFFFHPEQKHHGNKAGWSDQENQIAKPYGSATADGFRCLSALIDPSVPTQDSAENRKLNELVSETAGWLEEKHQAEPNVVPGFADADQESSWAYGLKFYFWMSHGKSVVHFPSKKYQAAKYQAAIQRQATFKQLIEQLQKQDGRWENPNARMREDDPVIATSFAIIALADKPESQADDNQE
jgi:hypothetical protein